MTAKLLGFIHVSFDDWDMDHNIAQPLNNILETNSGRPYLKGTYNDWYGEEVLLVTDQPINDREAHNFAEYMLRQEYETYDVLDKVELLEKVARHPDTPSVEITYTNRAGDEQVINAKPTDVNTYEVTVGNQQKTIPLDDILKIVYAYQDELKIVRKRDEDD